MRNLVDGVQKQLRWAMLSVQGEVKTVFDRILMRSAAFLTMDQQNLTCVSEGVVCNAGDAGGD